MKRDLYSTSTGRKFQTRSYKKLKLSKNSASDKSKYREKIGVNDGIDRTERYPIVLN